MLTLNGVLTEEQRLEKAIVAIISEKKYTALAGVLMIGDKVIDESIPTACTNGRDEKYGREYVKGINDAELRGLALHENKHKVYRHLNIWKHLWEIDAQLANMAMDYVINLEILDENPPDERGVRFAELPEGGLVDEQYRGMNTAQVFKILRKKKQDNESGGDTDSCVTDTNGGFDHHDFEGAQELSADEQRDLARDIDEAIRQGAMSAGKMGVNQARSLDELLQPQVDWREVLREFIYATCVGNDYSTYSRPNRRLMSQGIYMPSGVSEKVNELVLAIDTSGSVEQRALTVMLTEVKCICDTVRPDKVRILYWGSDVVRDEVYGMHELDQLIQSTKPRGGGGTDVVCVTEYMKENNIKPQATIVLTDGYLFGGWGDWECPVLWAILDHKEAVPSTGKAVHIRVEDM
jgi:predicted metal-dependent peptidase